jgi:ssDNA thymidine ADP-ribosyltransferase, DarT
MIAYLNSRGLAFYHFTDVKNLASIRARKLLSLRNLLAEKIDFAPGGNQWSHDADRYKGVDRHVHLSLTPNHPMEYVAKQEGRIENTQVLKIRPEILATEGALITLGVANAKDTPLIEVEEAILKLDFAALYPKAKWRDEETFARYKIVRKGELLIPDKCRAT